MDFRRITIDPEQMYGLLGIRGRLTPLCGTMSRATEQKSSALTPLVWDDEALQKATIDLL